VDVQWWVTGGADMNAYRHAQAAAEQPRAAFAKARGACLEGRGYTVR